MICFNCKGTGKVRKYFYEKRDPICAMCNGSGQTPDRKEIPNDRILTQTRMDGRSAVQEDHHNAPPVADPRRAEPEKRFHMLSAGTDSQAVGRRTAGLKPDSREIALSILKGWNEDCAMRHLPVLSLDNTVSGKLLVDHLTNALDKLDAPTVE